MAVDEGTQTNGAPATSDIATQIDSLSPKDSHTVEPRKDPQAGLVNKADTSAERWTVESVVSKITPQYAENTSSPVPFFHLLERLKTTKRAGWVRFGITNAESISDHMYRMSILTMMAPKSISSKLNILRCTQMALIHDMAEALVGDITPVDNVPKAEKNRREAETMDYICTNLLGKFNGGLNGQELREIWQEYEDSVTLESHFVHDIDKIELILQMVEYERAHKGEIDLGEFTWVTKKILSPEVRSWSDHLLWERVELWQGLGKKPSWWDDEVTPKSKPAPL